jgi:hypothetical protein
MTMTRGKADLFFIRAGSIPVVIVTASKHDHHPARGRKKERDESKQRKTIIAIIPVK